MKEISKTWHMAILAVLVISCISFAQDVEQIIGYWEGAIINEAIPLVVKVEFLEYEGKVIGIFTIPEWYPDISYTSPITTSAGKYSFGLQNIGLVIAELDSFPDRLHGTIKYNLGSYKIYLSRVLKPSVPLITDEEFFITHGEVRIKVEMFLPQGKGPHPAVIFFHGRGEGSRHTQRSKAEMVATRGIAGVTFDRRGEGDSSGKVDEVTFGDLVDDGLAIIEHLKSDPRIDNSQIGLFGYSSGGWVVPHLAAKNDDVAFVITVAGPAVSVGDQQLQVVRQLMKNSGIDFSEADYKAASKHMKTVLNYVFSGKGWEQVQESNIKAKAEAWGRYVDIPESKMNSDMSWLRRFNSDPTESLRNITQPYLAIFGELDIVVPDEDNIPILNSLLSEAGNMDFTIKTLPGTRHGLYIRPEEGDHSWPRIAPGFNETILEWLLDHVRIGTN